MNADITAEACIIFILLTRVLKFLRTAKSFICILVQAVELFKRHFFKAVFQNRFHLQTLFKICSRLLKQVININNKLLYETILNIYLCII